MLADVQSSYGLARPFQGVGNFETEHQRNLVREVCAAVQTGRLIVVSGLVGSGKTHLLRRIEDELARAGKVAVAKSLAVDKRRTSLPSLIEALFYDLSPGDRAQVKIPKQAERRERDLRDIMRKGKRPVVLVVDEAHDLHHKTLTGLKRLMEVVADAGVLLSALLVGHPRRRTALPSLMEALFYELSPCDRAQRKIPKQAERRERDRRASRRKGKRPVVRVVDEAHDLHHKTLTGLKRLMEVVADAGVLLSVLLVGHPRLRNDLRRPQMEEIGYRTTTFDYEGIGAERRDYVAWLLGACAAEGVKVADLMNEDAIDQIGRAHV